MTTTLTASRIYLKTDFKLHIQQSDKCADHCLNWSLSDPKDVNFQNTCDQIHCLQCDRCQLLKDVHLKLCNIVDIMNDGDDKQEFLKLIEDAMMVIFDWKSHMVRTVNQDQFRLNTIEHLETDKALLVMDWAMKFLPLKYREKQTDWFGQRGKNWHMIVCIFRESDGSINVSAYVCNTRLKYIDTFYMLCHIYIFKKNCLFIDMYKLFIACTSIANALISEKEIFC